MKILFTGGGSGGHFYPLIAVAQELSRIAKEERLIPSQMYFMAPGPYDERLLFENDIAFIPVTAGKLRRYASWRNVTDAIKTLYGLLAAFWKVFSLYPDVVVGKGGFGSFPALFAARFLRIPVIIHESDSVPGRVNKWASKFARRIAVAFPEAGEYFPEKLVAYTGNPIRKEILMPDQGKSAEMFSLEPGVPVILVLGGSLGAAALNEVLLAALPELLPKYQVLHQTGRSNLSDIEARAGVKLQELPQKSRFHPFGYLSVLEVAGALSAASLVVSRAGSTIFEIAARGKPAILVPITESNGDHQRENAYNYARTGAASVIEEENLRHTIFVAEIEKILDNPVRLEETSRAARAFAKTDAAEVLAREILSIALTHEK